jgi:proline dehydrogenase
MPLAPAIRLVKGAYSEPPSVAFARKRDVDESFFELALAILRHRANAAPGVLALGTHDEVLIGRVASEAARQELRADACEVQMLYGVRPAAQKRVTKNGLALRVLISYGDHWFPWYMRRLAERPANVLFLAKSLVTR